MPVEPKYVDGGNLEDSDMKGVSSLLKMKEGWRNVAIDDGSDEEKEKAEGLGFVLRGIDMNEGNNGDEIENQASDGNGLIENGKDPKTENSVDGKDEYSIGDFIWSKIKSHPWWPGQIHDPSNASDKAMKLKQEGKFLVAYSGDGTFAWCASSQLRPFGDQFNEMANQSSSRDFVQAVEAAVEEIGRFVASKMTCSCFKGAILGKPIVINGGLKENAGFPDLGIEKLPISWIHQPLDLLTILKTYAQAPTNDASNLLEISTLKNWVSAFYGSKGVYRFAEYSGPKVIEGLEDPEKDAEETGKNLSRGPVEEDEWVKACSSGNRGVRKRKQKSIAEILQIVKTPNLTESGSSKVGGGNKEKRKRPVEEESEKSEDSGFKVFASRERKKSKYLSSPYKNPTSRAEGTSDAKKKKRGRKKKNASSKDVLFEIQTLAADPDISRKTESFHLVEQFLRDFKTSENDELKGDRMVNEQKKRGRTGCSEMESRKKKRIKKEDDLDIDTPIINLIGERKKKKKVVEAKRKSGKKKLEVEFVKTKLEDMSCLLEKSDGKLSKEVRLKLEGVLKGVLNKVASSSQ